MDYFRSVSQQVEDGEGHAAIMRVMTPVYKREDENFPGDQRAKSRSRSCLERLPRWLWCLVLLGGLAVMTILSAYNLAAMRNMQHQILQLQILQLQILQLGTSQAQTSTPAAALDHQIASFAPDARSAPDCSQVLLNADEQGRRYPCRKGQDLLTNGSVGRLAGAGNAACARTPDGEAILALQDGVFAFESLLRLKVESGPMVIDGEVLVNGLPRAQCSDRRGSQTGTLTCRLSTFFWLRSGDRVSIRLHFYQRHLLLLTSPRGAYVRLLRLR